MNLSTGMLVKVDRNCDYPIDYGLVIGEYIIYQTGYDKISEIESSESEIIAVSKVLTGADLAPCEWNEETLVRNLQPT